MDEPGFVEPVDCARDQSQPMRQAWKGWVTWGNLGLLLAAAVLPLGWLLPAAKLARVRVMERRGRVR